MGPLIVLLFLVMLAVLWMFFRFPPQTTQTKALRVVNNSIFGLGALVAALWALRVYTTYTSPDDAPWVAPVALAGALFAFAAVTFLGFLARNFLIFRPPPI